MALPSSGQIKFSEIKDEFGYSSMDGYRVSESYGGFDFALDNDTCGPNANASIPTSGAIKFSDFYNARRNIVVDFYSNPSGEEYRRSVKKRFKANNYIIVLLLHTPSFHYFYHHQVSDILVCKLAYIWL